MSSISSGQSNFAGGSTHGSGEIKPPRNRTKALVTKGTRKGREIVIKDFSRSNTLIKKMYGRPTLRREERAYNVLRAVPGIPECFGLEGRDRLVLEYVSGRLLADFKKGEVGPEVFDRVDEILATAHARGMAVGDLHASNIIITETGAVFLIDFANAVFARNPQCPGPLVRFFMDLDRHASARMRARYLRLPRPEPAGMFGFLYRLGRAVKTAAGGIKKGMHLGR